VAPAKKRSPRASVPDTNEVKLVGAVVRPVKFLGSEGLSEFTVAGHSPAGSGKVLPWYHKVLVAREIGEGLVPGMPVEILGSLDQHKFQVEGESAKRSIIRVIADELTVLDAALHPVSQIPAALGEMSFILDGGVNEVRLSGNLPQDAGRFSAPSGDPYARVQIAVEGKRKGKKKTSYFLLKAWRDQVDGVGQLKAGARLGLKGVLLSERYTDGKGKLRNAVLVEILGSKVRS
jgi:single-stranded DNA-binding protein